MKMNQKVLLILCDGLRPDALASCGNPYGQRLLSLGSYTLEAETVYPSLTLPCHMSLFHSIPPERHGTLSNTYAIPSHSVEGICERLSANEKTSAFFYNWGELRDLARPGALSYSFYASGDVYGLDETDEMSTENALSYIASRKPDFAFVYLQLTDYAGHDFGWMGEEYLHACSQSLGRVRRLVERFGEEYTIIVTADHGGHGRGHGTQEKEDMTVPLVCIGEGFTPGALLQGVSICDIAPTIAALEGVNAPRGWEGKSLI